MMLHKSTENEVHDNNNKMKDLLFVDVVVPSTFTMNPIIVLSCLFTVLMHSAMQSKIHLALMMANLMGVLDLDKIPQLLMEVFKWTTQVPPLKMNHLIWSLPYQNSWKSWLGLDSNPGTEFEPEWKEEKEFSSGVESLFNSNLSSSMGSSTPASNPASV
jgi:hypothetical protein